VSIHEYLLEFTMWAFTAKASRVVAGVFIHLFPFFPSVSGRPSHLLHGKEVFPQLRDRLLFQPKR
jgi:hypothetical protein